MTTIKPAGVTETVASIPRPGGRRQQPCRRSRWFSRCTRGPTVGSLVLVLACSGLVGAEPARATPRGSPVGTAKPKHRKHPAKPKHRKHPAKHKRRQKTPTHKKAPIPQPAPAVPPAPTRVWYTAELTGQATIDLHDSPENQAVGTYTVDEGTNAFIEERTPDGHAAFRIDLHGGASVQYEGSTIDNGCITTTTANGSTGLDGSLEEVNGGELDPRIGSPDLPSDNITVEETVGGSTCENGYTLTTEHAEYPPIGIDLAAENPPHVRVQVPFDAAFEHTYRYQSPPGGLGYSYTLKVEIMPCPNRFDPATCDPPQVPLVPPPPLP